MTTPESSWSPWQAWMKKSLGLPAKVGHLKEKKVRVLGKQPWKLSLSLEPRVDSALEVVQRKPILLNQNTAMPVIAKVTIDSPRNTYLSAWKCDQSLSGL